MPPSPRLLPSFHCQLEQAGDLPFPFPCDSVPSSFPTEVNFFPFSRTMDERSARVTIPWMRGDLELDLSPFSSMCCSSPYYRSMPAHSLLCSPALCPWPPSQLHHCRPWSGASGASLTMPSPPPKSPEPSIAYPSCLCLDSALRRHPDLTRVPWTAVPVARVLP